MSLKQIFDLCSPDFGSWVVVVLFVMSMIQIAPIKVNPWEYVFKWIGGQMGLSSIEDKLTRLQKSVEENQAMTSRYRIIRYDDEMMSGVIHSKDHEEQILEDINIYKEFCINHPDFVNHKGQGAMQRILTRYNNGEQT